MMADAGKPPQSVDAPAAIAAASILLAFNALAVNIQPILLGALVDSYGLSDRHLGYVSAVFVAFTSIATLSAPWWIRRVDWRRFSFYAVLGAIAAMTLGMIVENINALLLLFAALGLLKGFVGAPSFASLGDSANPDRNYGISVAAQAILSAVIAIPVAAYIIPMFGAQGLFGTLAILLALGLAAVRWLPRQGKQTEGPILTAGPLWSARAIPALCAFAALIFFVAGILGFWVFMERIGVSRGASSYITGLAVSSGSVSTILGALAVAWLGGRRVSSLAFIALGTALIIAGYGLLTFEGDAIYLVGANMFTLGWGLAQPAYWGTLRKIDATGRLFVVAPAASGAAGILLGSAAGPTIENYGYAGLLLLSSTLLLLGLATILIAQWQSRRQSSGADSTPSSATTECSGCA